MKEKNHFDSKDMMLLVAVLLVIYIVTSWFGNNGEVFDYGMGQETTETVETES